MCSPAGTQHRPRSCQQSDKRQPGPLWPPGKVPTLEPTTSRAGTAGGQHVDLCRKAGGGAAIDAGTDTIRALVPSRRSAFSSQDVSPYAVPARRKDLGRLATCVDRSQHLGSVSMTNTSIGAIPQPAEFVEPAAASGQVVVEVSAAGVNHLDLAKVSGKGRTHVGPGELAARCRGRGR